MNLQNKGVIDMDKEQLKKILEPVKKMCQQNFRRENCPLAGQYSLCLIKAPFFRGGNYMPVDNIDKSYIEMIDKYIHEFCGKESCVVCPQKCDLYKYPAKWNLDELP